MHLQNKNILSRLSNRQDILEFVLKLTPDELESFVSIANWNPALVSHLARHPAVVKMLNKLTVQERCEIVHLLSWSPGLITQAAAHDMLVFCAKLTDSELIDFKASLNWSTALQVAMVKSNAIDMMAKLTPEECAQLRQATEWSSALRVFMSSHNMMQLISKLTKDELLDLASICDWSLALLNNAADSLLLPMLSKLTPVQLKQFGDMVNWSPALLALLAKTEGVLEFIQSLHMSELQAFAQMLHWNPALLSRLRDEPKHMNVFYRFWDMVADQEQFIKVYFNLVDSAVGTGVNVFDAFSSGQLMSKLWLIDRAKSLGIKLGKTWTLCGWIGTLGWLMLREKTDLGISCIRSFDVDTNCAGLADTLNRASVKDGWMFKSFTQDINNLDYDAFEWSVWSNINNRMSYPITDSADTIINTSCDHMGGDHSWWNNIPDGKLVILQNNDWYENEQHNNSVENLAEFKRLYPMRELLFEGELDLTLYTRFMLIGRK